MLFFCLFLFLIRAGVVIIQNQETQKLSKSLIGRADLSICLLSIRISMALESTRRKIMQLIEAGVLEVHKDHIDNKSKRRIGRERSKKFHNLNINLSHDLICQEILPRLPAQILFRFKYVCKLWRSLPHNPDFVHRHLERSRNNSFKILFFSSKDYQEDVLQNELSFYSLDIEKNLEKPKRLFRFVYHKDRHYVMQPSCNGLVCFSSHSSGKIHVCNPSTHDLVRIMGPEVDVGIGGPRCKVAGFGLDQVTGKYKVLCGFYTSDHDDRKHYIFTLGLPDGCDWRLVDDMPCRINHFCNSAYVNGTVNWVTENREGLLSFSFEDEKYRVMSLPIYNYQLSAVSLTVGGAYLHLITRQFTQINGVDFWAFKCWKLSDVMNQVWTYEFNFGVTSHFSLPTLHPIIDDSSPIMRPISIQNGNLLLSQGEKLYTYNLKRNILRKIFYDLPGKHDPHATSLYQPGFVESVISISDYHPPSGGS